jgi:hypothetical protein
MPRSCGSAATPLRPKLFLSFEYNLNPSLWPNTKRCVGEAIRLGFTEANFTELASARWQAQIA